MSSESAFLDWLRQRAPSSSDAAPLGLEDDAALIRVRGPGDWILTTDMLMDGTDFLLSECDARLAGRKALAVNLSDLAAMAARPHVALVSVALPRRDGHHLGRQLYEGILDLANRFDVTLAGGDTNSWDGPLVISVTLAGTATQPGPLLRTGARPGDSIVVTGQFGGSILGHHLCFVPRVAEALHLNDEYALHAGMDVSDGLTLDLSRLAQASGCGAVLDLDTVPIAPAALQLASLRNDGTSALDHALGDGEDFELLLAVPVEEADRLVAEQPLDVPLTRIGQFVDEPGLWAALPDGRRQTLSPSGYLHQMDG
jgi:thiamine-monophosphate kinase